MLLTFQFTLTGLSAHYLILVQSNTIEEGREELHFNMHSDKPGRVLSSRQLQIMGLVAKGCTNREIANQLGIKERTVEDHLIKSYRILGAANRTGAIFRLLELGWLQLGATTN